MFILKFTLKKVIHIFYTIFVIFFKKNGIFLKKIKFYLNVKNRL